MESEEVIYKDKNYRVVRSILDCIDVWYGDRIVFCNDDSDTSVLDDLPEKIQKEVIREMI